MHLVYIYIYIYIDTHKLLYILQISFRNSHNIADFLPKSESYPDRCPTISCPAEYENKNQFFGVLEAAKERKIETVHH